MTALWCIAWATIAAVAVWRLMLARYAATVARIEAAGRKEIRHWQAEASWHRARAGQLAAESLAKAAAWQQGKDDILALMPLLAAVHGGCSCAHQLAQEVAEST